MKHFLALTLIFLSLPLVACTDPQATGTLPAVTTLDEVTAALSEIEFRSEWIDHRQAASETWSRKQGDCEDYAVLASELLMQLGIEGYRLDVYCIGKYKQYSHSVCVFRDQDLTGGAWWYWSNAILRKTELTNIEDMPARVRHESWIRSWKLLDGEGRIVQSG